MQTKFATDPVAVFAQQISTPGLGDHSYLVVAGDHAAVIDPQRDIERFDAAIRESGATLTAVIETHVHNDYVSGGPSSPPPTARPITCPRTAKRRWRITRSLTGRHVRSASGGSSRCTHRGTRRIT